MIPQYKVLSHKYLIKKIVTIFLLKRHLSELKAWGENMSDRPSGVYDLTYIKSNLN